MALTDILFKVNTVRAYRGNSGVVEDILFRHPCTGYVSPTYYGGYWTVSETFKDSNDVNLPNGTAIFAYHSTTFKLVGSGVVSSGVATFNVTTGDDVYLVADPSGLSGETVCTTAVTPT